MKLDVDVGEEDGAGGSVGVEMMGSFLIKEHRRSQYRRRFRLPQEEEEDVP